MRTTSALPFAAATLVSLALVACESKTSTTKVDDPGVHANTATAKAPSPPQGDCYRGDVGGFAPKEDGTCEKKPIPPP